MTPKKAIFILLIAFFIIAVVFFALYFKKQIISPDNSGADQSQSSQTGENRPLTPEEAVEEKVNKIIEDAKDNPEASPEAVRQDVISTINAEIIKQEESKTPEQKAADLKAQEERQKVIDQINDQIKQGANPAE